MVNAGGGVALDAQEGDLEWLQAAGQGFADSPHPQDADGLASQTHALRLAPDAGPKTCVCLGIFPGEGEHQKDGEFCHRDSVARGQGAGHVGDVNAPVGGCVYVHALQADAELVNEASLRGVHDLGANAVHCRDDNVGVGQMARKVRDGGGDDVVGREVLLQGTDDCWEAVAADEDIHGSVSPALGQAV